MLKTLLTLSLLIICPYAKAFNCVHRGLQEQARQIIKTAVVDEDGRMTEEEYAAAKGVPPDVVRSRFAATGKLKCGKYEGTAQLTGDNQTITTSAHMFTNRENCQSLVGPESCKFIVKNGSSVQTLEVGSLFAIGFKCPTLPRRTDDWAVLKLRKPAVGVRPYMIPNIGDEVGRKNKVISVSASTIDFRRVNPKSGKIEYPKSIEECETQRTYLALGKPILVNSNCDFSSGNSGGSIIKESTDGDVLAAISVSNNETEQDRENIMAGGQSKSGPYKENEWTTYHIPLGGEFLFAIEKAIGGRSL